MATRHKIVAPSDLPLQSAVMLTVARAILLLHVLTLSSASAVASTYRGADWGLLFVFYTLPYAAIPIGLSVLFAALKFFRNGTFFAVYALAAVLVASFFLLMSLRAPGGFASAAIAVTEVLLVLALTLLPPWLQQTKARSQRAAGANDAGSQ